MWQTIRPIVVVSLALWVYCIGWCDKEAGSVAAGYHTGLTAYWVVLYPVYPDKIDIVEILIPQMLIAVGMVLDSTVYWRYIYFGGMSGLLHLMSRASA